MANEKNQSLLVGSDTEEGLAVLAGFFESILDELPRQPVEVDHSVRPVDPIRGSQTGDETPFTL